MFEKNFFLANESRTREFGLELGKQLLPGDFIALYGSLGAGKTTLVRGLVQYLCGTETDVPSPTYTLVQTYETSRFTICHFDLYRVDSPSELDELGWEDSEETVALVEWPTRAGDRLPEQRLDAVLQSTVQGGREATLSSKSKSWNDRINNLKFTNR